MLVTILLLASASAADVHVTFSGRALDTSGAAINNTLPVQIRLMDSDAGGSNGQLWTDTFTDMPLSDGYFSVVLGSDDPLPASVFRDNTSVWVEATIGTTVLARQELGDVPSAATARAIVLPAPSAGCADGALAYDSGTAEVQVCVAGAWSGLASDAQIECVGRGGEWTVSGCTEYAVEGCDPCNSFGEFISTCSAMPGRHACTWTEYGLSTRSIQGQAQDGIISIDSGYMWVAGYNASGNSTTTGNQIWYPWSGGSGDVTDRMVCGNTSAVMMGLFQDSGASAGANGCYQQTYSSALGACCRNFEW
ncbi:MAG: hypothetical protein ACJATT_000657 [Myxococcota bacterium]|jgi:hypothetical protein